MAEENDKPLVVLIGGRRAGVVTMTAAGRLTLTYDEAWQTAGDSIALSLSMPLVQQTHGGAPVRAFLWGLLPDNEGVLERWAQRYQVSARNPFAMLRHVGEDCAGAAQFARPDRVNALMADEGAVQWMNEHEVGKAFASCVEIRPLGTFRHWPVQPRWRPGEDGVAPRSEDGPLGRTGGGGADNAYPQAGGHRP